MQPDTFAILGFMAFFGGGLGALFWKRLDRIERELGQCVRRSDFERFQDETRTQFAELRGEIAELRAEMRAEIASLRSDITQIALAIGAGRPRASEG